jgi:hypothetical protein
VSRPVITDKRLVFSSLERGTCGGSQPTLSAALEAGGMILPTALGQQVCSFGVEVSGRVAYAQSVPSCLVPESGSIPIRLTSSHPHQFSFP